MAEGQDDDDKTEEPTQHKLDQARGDGDIIYSSEVGAALSLIASTAIIAFLSGPIATELARGFLAFIASPQDFSTDPAALQVIASAVTIKMLGVFGMAALALALAGIAARYLQDQPTLTGKRMEPKLDKLDPIKGLGRTFGKQAGAAFLKSIAKFLVVGAAMAWALWPHDAEMENISLLDPASLLLLVRDKAVGLMIALASAAALLAAVDYVFTRQSYMQRLKMSRREIKEEMRQNDGDPMIKAKLRQIRADRGRRRMMAQVPQASVVITNPTHYSIALKYVQGETPAPICLAKGVDATALRIREVAKEHNIPIIEEPPLARALFATADIDEPIPREHYEAVAKIIGVVMSLGRRRGRAPSGPNRRQ